MKKAVLSNRIFLNFEDELYEKVKAELTYKVPAKDPRDPPVIKKTYNIMEGRFITLPIGRTDLIPEDYTIVDKRSINPVEFPEFGFTLREDQQAIYDRVEDNCLIDANPSWGKTFTAIAIAKKLGQKTLVICHTINLRDQWVKEVKKTLGLTPGLIGGVKVGKSRKTVIDYKNKLITIANVQTLRKNINMLKKEFGLVIMDEVHHAPATIFNECMDTSHARYKIGLSGTLKRKDYLHVIIPDYFSKTIYKAPRKNQLKPEIVIIETGIPFNSNPMIPWANKVNELVARPEYLDLITSVANRYADLGHSVLVVSDRTEFLDSCNNRSGDRAEMVYFNTENRDEIHRQLTNKEIDILYGAINIYKEGISLDVLSCLILGAPTNNDPLLEQLIGRIQRPYKDKLQPVVVDFVFTGKTAKKQARNRLLYYIRNAFKITHIDLTQK